MTANHKGKITQLPAPQTQALSLVSAFSSFSPELQALLWIAYRRAQKSNDHNQMVTLTKDLNAVFIFMYQFSLCQLPNSQFTPQNFPLALTALDKFPTQFRRRDFYHYYMVASAKDLFGGEVLTVSMVQKGQFSPLASHYFFDRIPETMISRDRLLEHMQIYLPVIKRIPKLHTLHVVTLNAKKTFSLVYHLLKVLTNIQNHGENYQRQRKQYICKLSVLINALLALAYQPEQDACTLAGILVPKVQELTEFIAQFSADDDSASLQQSLLRCHERCQDLLSDFIKTVQKEALTEYQRDKDMALLTATFEADIMLIDFVSVRRTGQELGTTIGLALFHPLFLEIFSTAFDHVPYCIEPVVGKMETRDIAYYFEQRLSPCELGLETIPSAVKVHGFLRKHPFPNAWHDFFHYMNSIIYANIVKNTMNLMVQTLKKATSRDMSLTIWQIADRAFTYQYTQTAHLNPEDIPRALSIRMMFDVIHFALSREKKVHSKYIPISVNLATDCLSVDEALLMVICMLRDASRWCDMLRIDTSHAVSAENVMLRILNATIKTKGLVQSVKTLIASTASYSNEQIIALVHLKLKPRGMRALFFIQHAHDVLTWPSKGQNIICARDEKTTGKQFMLSNTIRHHLQTMMPSSQVMPSAANPMRFYPHKPRVMPRPKNTVFREGKYLPMIRAKAQASIQKTSR